jgi:glutamine cyclotransferase
MSDRRRTSRRTVAAALGLALVAACAPAPGPVESRPLPPAAQASNDSLPVHGFEVVRAIPHDAAAFTQGLVFHDGFLYESTGLEGQSTLRQLEVTTGRVLRRHDLAPHIFAEGLTIWRDTLLQLTYKNRTAFAYDLRTFAPRGTFTYEGEGWGLTHDGTRLIMSDGQPELRFLDPATWRELGRVPVTERGRPVVDLNELEFIRGQVWANVWHTDRIARIDPASGRVMAWIDLTGLRPAATRQDPESVLNGIAFDAGSDRLFVTGKLWPFLYEIRVREAGLSGRGR